MVGRDERGEVSKAVIYAVAAIVILVIGIAIFVLKNKSDSSETPTPAPTTELTQPPTPEGNASDGSTATVAPTGDPRVSGTWQLVFHVRSSSVSSVDGKSYSIAYDMEPRCSTGACDTVVKSSPAITLKQSGAKYKGSANTNNTATCSGSAGPAQFSLILKVKHSETSASGEEARKLAGSAKQTGPAQGGCSSFNVTYDVTGKPTGGAGSKAALPTVPQTRPVTSGGSGSGGGGTTSGGTSGGGGTGQTGQ